MLFPGRIVIHPTMDRAVMTARIAWRGDISGKKVFFNLFCDASRSGNRGGIAVVFQPLVRANPMLDSAGFSWFVNNLHGINLGELLAVAKSLVVAAHEIAQFGYTAHGKPIVIRIFNDNKYNLQYIEGTRKLETHEVTVIGPVLDFIRAQAIALQNMGFPVETELHWIPGHEHDINPHQWSDQLAKGARISGFASVNRDGNSWTHTAKPFVVQHLEMEIAQAVVTAKAEKAELQAQNIDQKPAVSNKPEFRPPHLQSFKPHKRFHNSAQLLAQMEADLKKEAEQNKAAEGQDSSK